MTSKELNELMELLDEADYEHWISPMGYWGILESLLNKRIKEIEDKISEIESHSDIQTYMSRQEYLSLLGVSLRKSYIIPYFCAKVAHFYSKIVV